MQLCMQGLPVRQPARELDGGARRLSNREQCGPRATEPTDDFHYNHEALPVMTGTASEVSTPS